MFSEHFSQILTQIMLKIVHVLYTFQGKKSFLLFDRWRNKVVWSSARTHLTCWQTLSLYESHKSAYIIMHKRQSWKYIVAIFFNCHSTIWSEIPLHRTSSIIIIYNYFKELEELLVRTCQEKTVLPREEQWPHKLWIYFMSIIQGE